MLNMVVEPPLWSESCIPLTLTFISCYPRFNWPSKWIDLYSMTENLQQTISITKVAWRKPQDNFVKIKSDGSALSNPGKIGAGTIIRDQHGNFIHAIATPLGEGTNNQAELKLILLVFSDAWKIDIPKYIWKLTLHCWLIGSITLLSLPGLFKWSCKS